MTKVISLSDRAYEIISKLKGKGESFSDVILRLTKKKLKKPLTSYAGKWRGDDIEHVFKKVLADREEGESREVKF